MTKEGDIQVKVSPASPKFFEGGYLTYKSGAFPETIFFQDAKSGKVENIDQSDREVIQYKTDESVNDAIDEKLAVLEHRIVQKIMELSAEIKELKKENKRLWRALREIEQAVDRDNWVSEELKVEEYLRSSKRFEDFGRFAMGV